MKWTDLPLASRLAEIGPNDRVFDTLLMLGPLLILLLAILGRSIVTEALAVVYIAVFLGYVLYRAVSNPTGYNSILE
jgi:hypothetical protein